MRIYISGPITNVKNYAERFQAAEDHLRERFPKAEIVNPTKLVPFDPDKSWRDYMREDLKALLDCQAIYMIPGWSKSRGAELEHQIAQAFEMVIIYGK